MATVGRLLKIARERKRISYKEVTDFTKIGEKYLKAIESDNFSVFPSETYIIGFIRNYAKYLEFDVDQILSAYKKQIQQDNEPLRDRLQEYKINSKYDEKSSEEKQEKREKEVKKVEEIKEVIETYSKPAKPVKEVVKKIKREDDKKSKLFLIIEKLKKNDPVPVLIIAGIILLFLIVIFLLKGLKIFLNPRNDKVIEMSEMRHLDFEKEKVAYDIVYNDYYKMIIGTNKYSIMAEKAEQITNIITETNNYDVLIHLNDSIVQLSTKYEKDIDLNLNGIKDIKLTLNAVYSKRASITFEKLHKFNIAVIETNNVQNTIQKPDKKEESSFTNVGEKTKIYFEAHVAGATYIEAFTDSEQKVRDMFYKNQVIKLEADDVIIIKIGNVRGLSLIKINGRVINDWYKSETVVNKIIKWEKDPMNESYYQLVYKDQL